MWTQAGIHHRSERADYPHLIVSGRQLQGQSERPPSRKCQRSSERDEVVLRDDASDCDAAPDQRLERQLAMSAHKDHRDHRQSHCDDRSDATQMPGRGGRLDRCRGRLVRRRRASDKRQASNAAQSAVQLWRPAVSVAKVRSVGTPGTLKPPKRAAGVEAAALGAGSHHN